MSEKSLQNRFAKTPKLTSGDQLRNRVSGQDVWVINDDGEIVYLKSDSPVIKYPLTEIFEEFELVKKADD